jgi:AraC-like DNA-binding protein
MMFLAEITNSLWQDQSCLKDVEQKNLCGPYVPSLLLAGFLTGTLSLPFLWLKAHILEDVRAQPSGEERFWVILALIGLVIFLLSLIFSVLIEQVKPEYFEIARTVLGLGFVYLSTTCLFRIYPLPAQVITAKKTPPILQDREREILKKIEHKLEFEKVFLEPSYSRSDLARELQIPESHLSRLINNHFEKSLPVLFNEYRVKEACQLLQETEAPIQVISSEVGFNSLASFNRVFKDVTGLPASVYRDQKKNP